MTRFDKLRAVAQQAHDNGDCVCCLPDEPIPAKLLMAMKAGADAVIKKFEALLADLAEVLCPVCADQVIDVLNQAIRAALEGEQ